MKGPSPKESSARSEYEAMEPVSWRPLWIKGRGVCTCGKAKPKQGRSRSESEDPQSSLHEDEGSPLNWGKSHVQDPKPGDLALGRAKPPLKVVEARRGVGVKSTPLTWG